MGKDFHERYVGGEIEPPPERSTGLVFAAVATIIALLWRNSPTVLWLSLAAAGSLVAISLMAPNLLKPLNHIWFKLGLVLHRVVNPLVLFAIFMLVFVPTGIIMRLFRDPLRERRETAASTYWIDRRERGALKSSMTDQF